jgi:hypothetical protein
MVSARNSRFKKWTIFDIMKMVSSRPVDTKNKLRVNTINNFLIVHRRIGNNKLIMSSLFLSSSHRVALFQLART